MWHAVMLAYEVCIKSLSRQALDAGPKGYDGGKMHNSGSSERYGAGFDAGDKVTCRVDLGKGTIEFAKNGKWQGVAYKNVKGPLRAAISMYYLKTSVRMLWLKRDE